MTGFDERTIRRQTQALHERGLLGDYRRGVGSHVSVYEVCRSVLPPLYRYVGPILTPEYQGVRGVALRENLTGGLVIYGYHDQQPLIVQWEQLWAWQRASLSQGLPE